MPKRRHICIGKIEKVGKYDMCQVGFRDLADNEKVPSWFFAAEEIADWQIQRGSNKKMLQKKFHERLREIIKKREDQFDVHSTHLVIGTVNLVLFVVF